MQLLDQLFLFLFGKLGVDHRQVHAALVEYAQGGLQVQSHLALQRLFRERGPQFIEAVTIALDNQQPGRPYASLDHWPSLFLSMALSTDTATLDLRYQRYPTRKMGVLQNAPLYPSSV